jgi:hypothetical protein
MAIKLNQAGYDHAVAIIKNGLEVEQDTNNWDEIKATEDEIIRYLDSHTLSEYGEWFLGIDTEADPNDKSKYIYPFGDFNVLHKGALTLIEKEAARANHADIKKAVQQLLELVDEYTNE